MSTNDYHFITRWRIQGTIEEIAHILADASGLTRWWPSVYLDVRELAPGDARGLGKQIGLYTKGWLPYTLRWQFRISEIASDGFTLQAEGDFDLAEHAGITMLHERDQMAGMSSASDTTDGLAIECQPLQRCGWRRCGRG